METWLSPGVNSGELFDSRYQVFRQDRDAQLVGKSRGGGLIIAVKNNLQAIPQPSLNECTPHLESMWVKCSFHSQDILLCLCYFPPPVKPETMEDFAETLCQNDELLHNQIIFLGDFNIPNYHPPTPDNNPTGVLLYLHKIINFFDLESLNKVKNHNNRTLDLCLTNYDSNKITRKKVTACHIEKADGLVQIDNHHPPLILKINIRKCNTNITKSNSDKDLCFNFNKTDFESLKLKLNNIDWKNLYKANTSDEKTEIFYSEVNKVFLTTIPLRNTKAKKENFPKWWNPNTITLFKKKERIRKIKRKTAKQTIEYNKLRKSCKTEIQNDYQTYINKITALVKTGNSKPFWDFTKEKGKEPPKKILTYNNTQISDPPSIVNAFAEHFKNAYNQNTSSYAPDLTNVINSSPEYFHMSSIRESDVAFEIKKMKINKPPGPDGIPPKLFRNCVDQLKTPLAHIFNHSLQSGVFPSQLKVSNVTPVPKKSGDLNIANHRPVSNLNVLSKIFEGVIYNNISAFVFSKISPQQHGFVNRKSTIENLIEFSDFVARSISKKGEVHACYTDIEKCFDKISHDAILTALIKTGFSISNTNFFASYLQNRKIHVKYLNHQSNPIIPPSGIVQGSKLSSLLFILTYNDIHNYIKHSEVLLYADDLKIFKIVRDQNDCHLLQEDINSVSQWLHSIGLNFHPAKCSIMSYTTNSVPIQYTYSINNTPLHYVAKYKDLGIIFQNNLLFDLHRNEIEQKAFRRLGMVIRNSKSISDLDVIKMLYLTLVRPILEYGSTIWLPLTQCGKKALERIQARFVRYLFHKENKFYPLYPHYIEYELLAENLPIETLEQRRENEQIKLLKRICSGKTSSSYLIQKTQINVPDPRLRRNTDNFFYIPNIPTPFINHLLKSPLIAAFNTFNNMSERPDLF